MNAGQLYKDEYYAYYEDPPRGRTPLGAAKVRLKATESRKSSYDTNKRTYAIVTVVVPGSRDPSSWNYGKQQYCKEGQELTVPARHLIDFWDDYQAEANLLLAEKEERQRKHRKHELTIQVTQNVINIALQQRGVHIPVAIIDLYEDSSGFVKFSLSEVLRWLEIDPQAIEDKVAEIMEN